MNPDTPQPVIDLMEEQKKITKKGGTMRLGAYPCDIREGTRVHKAYEKTHIWERHRHRYEINNKYLDELEKNGMMASGINPDSQLVEIMEITDHPWYVGVQFHPEYSSTVMKPHPLFIHFIGAVLRYREKQPAQNTHSIKSS
jgi:CTP synthase